MFNNSTRDPFQVPESTTHQNQSGGDDDMVIPLPLMAPAAPPPSSPFPVFSDHNELEHHQHTSPHASEYHYISQDIEAALFPDPYGNIAAHDEYSQDTCAAANLSFPPLYDTSSAAYDSHLPPTPPPIIFTPPPSPSPSPLPTHLSLIQHPLTLTDTTLPSETSNSPPLSEEGTASDDNIVTSLSPSPSSPPVAAVAPSQQTCTGEATLTVIAGPSNNRKRGRPPMDRSKGRAMRTNSRLRSRNTFQPAIIRVAKHENVVAELLSFAEDKTLLILSASGILSHVELLNRSQGTDAKIASFKGIFDIISLNGTIANPTEDNPNQIKLTISLAKNDGQILGGKVEGRLLAYSTVQIIAGIWTPSAEELSKRKSERKASSKDHVSSEKPMLEKEVEKEEEMNKRNEARLEQEPKRDDEELAIMQHLVEELSEQMNNDLQLFPPPSTSDGAPTGDDQGQ